MAKQTVKQGNTNGKVQRKFNETVTALFSNDNFGTGSYISRPLDKDVVIKAGNSLLFKVTGKTASSGNKVSFLEILPPREERQAAAAQDDSDIG